MIDDSIIQLLEASKTVNIFMRNVEAEPANTVRQGHFDCTCAAVPPMSGNRSYLTTKLKLMARDGCEAQIGFVWSPDDQAWTMVENDTLEYQILRTAGRYDAYIDVQRLLDGNGIYVRLVNVDGKTKHVNKRVSFQTAIAQFTRNDPNHEIDRIRVATTPLGRLPVGSYLDPAISMAHLLSWMDGARLNARAYAATPSAARQLERAGLATNRTANNMVKLEVGTQRREGDVTDIPEADLLANVIRQRGREVGPTHVRDVDFADRYAMAVTALHDPEREWYDEDDDI